MWGRINAFSGKKKSSTIASDIEGSTYSDPSDVAEALGKYFAKLFAVDAYSPAFQNKICTHQLSLANFKIPEDLNVSAINNLFSMQELAFALGHSNGKSAGPDGIDYPLRFSNAV